MAVGEVPGAHRLAARLLHLRQRQEAVTEMQANGQGDIDLLGYIRVLHENNYTGPVDLEIIGAKDYELPDCVAIAAEARGHMQASLQACGAR